jgi:hypothetical protein
MGESNTICGSETHSRHNHDSSTNGLGGNSYGATGRSSPAGSPPVRPSATLPSTSAPIAPVTPPDVLPPAEPIPAAATQEQGSGIPAPTTPPHLLPSKIPPWRISAEATSARMALAQGWTAVEVAANWKGADYALSQGWTQAARRPDDPSRSAASSQVPSMTSRKVLIVADGTLRGLGNIFHHASEDRWRLLVYDNHESLSLLCEEADVEYYDNIIYVTSGNAFWPSRAGDLLQIEENIQSFDVEKTSVVFLGSANFWAAVHQTPVEPRNEAFFRTYIRQLTERGIRTTVMTSSMESFLWNNGSIAKESMPSFAAKLDEVFVEVSSRNQPQSVQDTIEARTKERGAKCVRTLAERRLYVREHKDHTMIWRRHILFGPEGEMIANDARSSADAANYFGLFDD